MKSLTLQNHFNGRVTFVFVANLEDSGDFTLNGEAQGSLDEAGDRDTYYWAVTVQKEDVPSLAKLLRSAADEDVIDTIKREWLETEGKGLEELIRDSDVPSELNTWGAFQF